MEFEKEATTEEVTKFHKNADTDGSADAIHHSLGSNREQAAPGNHTHDGVTSRSLMEGVNITGSRGSNAALGSLLTALSDALGFTDNTTP